MKDTAPILVVILKDNPADPVIGLYIGSKEESERLKALDECRVLTFDRSADFDKFIGDIKQKAFGLGFRVNPNLITTLEAVYKDFQAMEAEK